MTIDLLWLQHFLRVYKSNQNYNTNLKNITPIKPPVYTSYFIGTENEHPQCYSYPEEILKMLSKEIVTVNPHIQLNTD